MILDRLKYARNLCCQLNWVRECKRSKQPFADDKQPHPIETRTITTGTSHLCLYPTVCILVRALITINRSSFERKKSFRPKGQRIEWDLCLSYGYTFDMYTLSCYLIVKSMSIYLIRWTSKSKWINYVPLLLSEWNNRENLFCEQKKQLFGESNVIRIKIFIDHRMSDVKMWSTIGKIKQDCQNIFDIRN